MKRSLFTLALGTLVLGITEFVMMAILPEVAVDLGVSIPEAGHLISAYALGVSFGAPMLVFSYRFRPKRILQVLSAMMVVGAVLSVLSPSYPFFLAARFISGLPHGAYFGVASIVAVRLADERHKSTAVSIMISGMTVANLIGIPLASRLTQMLSWRFPFVLAIGISLCLLLSVSLWVPNIEPTPTKNFRSQFAFLRHLSPWLVLGATMLGNGGIFCWYSYVAPVLTQVGGFPLSALSALMIAAGAGMVAGNLLSGRLSDRFSPEGVGMWFQLVAAASLLLIFFVADWGWLSALLMVVCTACLFGMSGPEQYLILKHAPGGEMLGGAAVQMAFNLGNAMGAFVGGLPIAASLSPRYCALVGVPVCLMGAICFVVLFRKRRNIKA